MKGFGSIGVTYASKSGGGNSFFGCCNFDINDFDF